MSIIFKDAISPNSWRVWLLVRMKAAKPEAVERFVSSVIFPTLLMLLDIAFILFLCPLNSL